MLVEAQLQSVMIISRALLVEKFHECTQFVKFVKIRTREIFLPVGYLNIKQTMDYYITNYKLLVKTYKRSLLLAICRY